MTTAVMVQTEVVKMLADVLKAELGLRDDQIMLDYVGFEIPNNKDLYIALSTISTKPLAMNNRSEPSNVGVTEYTDATFHGLIQIDVMSFGSEARERKEEILMALNSTTAEQSMETYAYQISKNVGEFIDASSLEETKFLNRFTATIPVTYRKSYKKYPPYFDQFQNPPEVTFNE